MINRQEELLTKILSGYVNEYGINSNVWSGLMRDKEISEKLAEVRDKTVLASTTQLKLLANGYTIKSRKGNSDLYGSKWNKIRTELFVVFRELYPLL